MRRALLLLLLTAGLARAEVVVAIRYLQVEGVSHAHLYLFSDGGKLLRQLTKEATGQDHDPVFSPDGQEIVFGREQQSGEEWWSVHTDGSGARRLPEPPVWHAVKEPPRFDYPPDVPVPNHPNQRRLEHATKPGELRFNSPDDSCTLILRDAPAGADAADSYYPKTAFLQVGKTKGEQPLEALPAIPFSQTGTLAETAMRRKGLTGTALKEIVKEAQESVKSGETFFSSLLVRDGSPFLISPPLRVAFFQQHRGSTYGEGRFAIDLEKKRIFELTTNGARIIPIPGAPEFLCVCEELYLPLGDGRKSVNCTFLDRWDAQLHRTRFAEAKPAIFYGASLSRPGAAVVAIPKEEAE